MRNAAESNLPRLLASLEPSLVDGECVFATVPADQRRRWSNVSPICEFRESEGISLIVRRAEAEAAGLPFAYPCRQITLTVHSDLAAVGLLAAVTTRLAAHGISVNAQSAYFHDHLFVISDRADEALAVLRQLAADWREVAGTSGAGQAYG